MMKKYFVLVCAVLMLSSYTWAQEEFEEEDRFAVEYNFNEPGDQFINISLMATFPLNFGGSFPLYREGQLATGGAGSIGYHRFITSWFAIGMDLSFGYAPTIGENMFTYVPFTLCFTFQPSYKRFEFPLTFGIGCATESYLNRTYFPGLIIKPQAGVFYRATPSWSFGIRGEYMMMPQWYDDPQYDDIGHFASFAIAARYHF